MKQKVLKAPAVSPCVPQWLPVTTKVLAQHQPTPVKLVLRWTFLGPEKGACQYPFLPLFLLSHFLPKQHTEPSPFSPLSALHNSVPSSLDSTSQVRTLTSLLWLTHRVVG